MTIVQHTWVHLYEEAQQYNTTELWFTLKAFKTGKVKFKMYATVFSPVGKPSILYRFPISCSFVASTAASTPGIWNKERKMLAFLLHSLIYPSSQRVVCTNAKLIQLEVHQKLTSIITVRIQPLRHPHDKINL